MSESTPTPAATPAPSAPAAPTPAATPANPVTEGQQAAAAALPNASAPAPVSAGVTDDAADQGANHDPTLLSEDDFLAGKVEDAPQDEPPLDGEPAADAPKPDDQQDQAYLDALRGLTELNIPDAILEGLTPEQTIEWFAKAKPALKTNADLNAQAAAEAKGEGEAATPPDLSTLPKELSDDGLKAISEEWGESIAAPFKAVGQHVAGLHGHVKQLQSVIDKQNHALSVLQQNLEDLVVAQQTTRLQGTYPGLKDAARSAKVHESAAKLLASGTAKTVTEAFDKASAMEFHAETLRERQRQNIQRNTRRDGGQPSRGGSPAASATRGQPSLDAHEDAVLDAIEARAPEHELRRIAQREPS